eukprot:767262-Hanusia_phi.AAC.3
MGVEVGDFLETGVEMILRHGVILKGGDISLKQASRSGISLNGSTAAGQVPGREGEREREGEGKREGKRGDLERGRERGEGERGEDLERGRGRGGEREGKISRGRGGEEGERDV